MSTIRKIEGKSSPLIEASPGGKSCAFVEGWKAPKNWSDATLIIGGKGYTVDEVKAMLTEIATSQSLLTETTWTIQQIAAKHGITL
jgi:hypothetical protein